MTALLQAILNGIMAGALLAIPAVGLTAMFSVLRYPNFCVGPLATVGAFTAWVLNVHYGVGVLPAVVVAFAVSAVTGVAIEQLALARLRPSGALTVAIGSIAAMIVLENLVRFFFGNDLRSFDTPLVRDWFFWGLRVGPQQLQTAVIAVVIMSALFAFFLFSRYGKAMRAVADNPDLSRIYRIDPTRIAIAVVALGSGLAGIGGVLLGLDSAIEPMTGSRLLLPIFAAAVLGGLGSIPGALFGALLIGLGEELSLLAIPPTYRSAIGFVVILLVLSIRPQGLFGERR
ncbi:branched-chain amino acid ABC transporter permease [Mesorhizobium sp. L-8-10]|uniref:branched-chain amino acid ABC transporter permease n=1 Tax=Mesorhizobium sp. L-8-10 TaxID=2744523 RepID=UPI00192631D2|nr:branched-chain amino acid ABC transporter permease [Mesorhizobium sp. L-8-10]BCH28510.1 branched-chain amino acid ABC transporter permease [Mesorhizobium sp. L-8-10]